jgi:hypothetical protein
MSLVRVDPATGLVTQVGPISTGRSMADLTFSKGTLYGIDVLNPNLYRINPATGAAVQVGQSGISGFTLGGALAANPAGTLFAAPVGASAGLYTLDPNTGVATLVANLTGAPIPDGSINAMDFDSSGSLFAANSNRGLPALVDLVRINPATGQVTNIGPSIDNLDALAFQPPAQVTLGPEVPEPGSLVLLAVGSLGLIGYRRCRRGRAA